MNMNTQQRLLQSLKKFQDQLSEREKEALSVILPKNSLFEENLANFQCLPSDRILTEEERDILHELDSSDLDTSHNTLRSHTFMIMKATRLCNLRCTYCHSWRDDPSQRMKFRVLAKATRDILKAANVNQVDFVWHGGEVTLLPISFFKKALWLQNYFRSRNQVISNSLQTNATRLSDEWISFIKANKISVGVSLDGPPEIHDRRRLNKFGAPTSQDVLKGIQKLKDENIPFGVLVVVDRDVVEYGPDRLLDYLTGLGIQGVALLNAIPDNTDNTDRQIYLPWPQFVDFLEELFVVWWSDYKDKINIRELQSLVQNVDNGRASVCEFSGNCMGQFLTIEADGRVSACDKYIGDQDFTFGNLLQADLPSMLKNSSNLDLAKVDVNNKMLNMSKCKYFKYCFGGCPHDSRLNELNIEHWDSRCCGLSSLIDKIKECSTYI
ncbi:radical SAM additional 4Fe4S-binding domain protein [Leptolyngbya sp. PCC 7375]|nr:radical SAM additional 4Fe4S-binding domain protein [Leptolyngbya sp. PCC 7375]